MLYHLIYPFHEIYGFLNLFRYITFRSILAGVGGLILTVIIGYFYIKKNKGKIYSIKEFIPENHKKKKVVPNNGGVVIVGVCLFVTVLTGNFYSPNLWILLIGFTAFALLGFYDDFHKKVSNNSRGLRARKKFLIQILISIVIMGILYWNGSIIELVGVTAGEKSSYPFTLVFIPFTKNMAFNLSWGYWILGVFMIVASVNAVNLTDGLDGLAIGLSLFVILTFIIIAYTSGNIVIAEYLKTPYLSDNGEITVFLAALAGSCLGFLWYNCHPAQVFMGDTGSLALGSVIGISAIILKVEILLPLIAGVFVIEALSVIIQVFVYRKWKFRFFRMAPLHHHFEMIGWDESKIIFRFWIIGILLSLIALSTLKVR